jgi:radical SAM superfamily enzyme YgiQ (UPF0313 family)
MKITFIRPGMAGRQSADSLKPLAFMILFSLTPKDIEVAFFDERIEKLPETVSGDAVCFSVETFAAKRAYLLAEHYKRQNPAIKVIMGGFHPTACPDEAGGFADCVIAGDAEPVWEQVVSDLRGGCLRSRYTSDNSAMLPFHKMDGSIFDGKRYVRIGVVQWKRGCVFNCNFCSINSFYQSRVLAREADDVIAEIANMKEKLLFLADDNLLHDRDGLKVFLTKLAPLKKKWVCQISINVSEDDEIMDLMAKSGCVAMIIGFESLNAKNLAVIGKKQNMQNSDYDRAIQKIYARGMMIYATFIFGYPHDEPESFDEVYAFAMRHRFMIANFNPLMAMPATPLYDELKSAGRLIDEKWWLSDSYRYGDSMHRPKNYTAEQLTENCKRLRFAFYSMAGIVKRLLHPVNFRHLLLFLIVNIVSGTEIRRKNERSLHGEGG